MKLRLLSWLCSPCCRRDLTPAPGAGGEIVEGELRCSGCGASYPVREGVPRLHPGAAAAGVEKTRHSFAWEWNRYPGPLPEDKAVFLEETQLEPERLDGRLVMDAGCGMGRYARVALSLGAEVVAFDLSDAALRLNREVRDPKLHVVCGDLHRPPFREAIFDVIYSQGVLHHTSNTRTAFRRVAPLVKPGGLLSVWLYGMAGRYRDFSTNPIREGRGWILRHRRLAWLVVALRHWISDAVRALSTRLPVPASYALSYPLAALGAVPGIKYLTFSVHRDFQVRLIENFDWISPPYQYHHTKEELKSWYEAEGFTVLRVLPHGLVPKPGVLGQKTR